MGFKVFPIRPHGKEPVLGLLWKDAASNDPTQISKWAQEFPDANVGIKTGMDSGILIVDVDIDQEKGHNGQASLDSILSAHGTTLPITRQARTGRGGTHWFFKHPGGTWSNKNGKFGWRDLGDGTHISIKTSLPIP